MLCSCAEAPVPKISWCMSEGVGLTGKIQAASLNLKFMYRVDIVILERESCVVDLKLKWNCPCAFLFTDSGSWAYGS